MPLIFPVVKYKYKFQVYRRVFNMKVVVAVDSFKGSMTSMEAGTAVKSGILAAHPDAEVIVRPLADGGEGTTDALTEGLNGKRINLTVTGPMGEPVDAYYGYLEDTNTAVYGNGLCCGNHNFRSR